MKLTFLTNYLTHHQIPLAEEFYKKLGNDYTLIVTEPMEQERLKLGYKDMTDNYPFVIKAYENIQEVYRIAEESDIVIYGSAPDKFVIDRMKKQKLTFKYSERINKRDMTLPRRARSRVGIYRHYGKFLKYPFYILCASAYTSADVSKHWDFEERCYKWGYFTETLKYDNIDALIKQKKTYSILWAGRIIDWKHPEAAVNLAVRLRDAGYKFTLNIIGTGEAENKIKNMIRDENLQDAVHMTGAMSPENVREYMEKSEIFIFTSNFQEGWGAVLNEAMNSGCACVASHAIGAVPFLIKNGENGIIYKNGCMDDLSAKVMKLLDDRELCRKIGRNAYSTIVDMWNPKEAAQRFLELSQDILKGKKAGFCDGLCSLAEVMDNDWFNA
ncbi:MAG: glycosyltransferase family 4 protein [Clostridiales bacterium]|nr:glycosyltransferase family 4 protein [Clostridiales bacterium]